MKNSGAGVCQQPVYYKSCDPKPSKLFCLMLTHRLLAVSEILICRLADKWTSADGLMGQMHVYHFKQGTCVA